MYLIPSVISVYTPPDNTTLFRVLVYESHLPRSLEIWVWKSMEFWNGKCAGTLYQAILKVEFLYLSHLLLVGSWLHIAMVSGECSDSRPFYSKRGHCKHMRVWECRFHNQTREQRGWRHTRMIHPSSSLWSIMPPSAHCEKKWTIVMYLFYEFAAKFKYSKVKLRVLCYASFCMRFNSLQLDHSFGRTVILLWRGAVTREANGWEFAPVFLSVSSYQRQGRGRAGRCSAVGLI